MADSTKRKTFFVLALALALIIALVAVVAVVNDDDALREKLGYTYYILAGSIIACVLLVLSGYLWDSQLVQRLKPCAPPFLLARDRKMAARSPTTTKSSVSRATSSAWRKPSK